MGNSKIFKNKSAQWLLTWARCPIPSFGVRSQLIVINLKYWLISEAEMCLSSKATVENVSKRKGMLVKRDEILWWNESWKWVAFTESDPKHSLLQGSIPQIRAHNDAGLHCWILSFCKTIPWGRKEAKQQFCFCRWAH